MLTIDDIRSVPLFSTLAPAELERLAETSADLHLGAGEFAVHEGGDRALYAVLSGKIEVVKLFDGIERTLGWRVPGTIFGEVPIAFGTVFVGGYRASEPSRVLRVDPKQYYAVAATSPEVVAKVGALARERMGGLQGIAAEAPKARVAMVGHRWDAQCSALRQFLARNQISLRLDDTRRPRTGDALARNSSADADCPVLRLTDGTFSGGPRRANLPSALVSRRARGFPSTTPSSSAAGRPDWRLPFTVRRRDCAPSWSSARRPEARPGLRRASRTISASPAAYRATNLRAARSSRRGGSGRRSWSRAPSPDSMRRRVRFASMATTSCGGGPSFLPPA